MRSAIALALAATLSTTAVAQENLLNLYSSRHYQTDEALYSNFTKTTGIKLNRIEAGEDPLIERIKNEGAASPADVLVTVDAGRLWRAEQAGLFQPIDSKVLTARLPVDKIAERWALYEQGLEEGGHDEATRTRLRAQNALWRNVYVAESDAQAEDELSHLLTEARHHMMHVRDTFNPTDFSPAPETLNAWTDPGVDDAIAVPYVLETGSIYGSPKRVREQVAELRDVGVQHLLCQTGFGDMSQAQTLASMRRFGEEVMPAFQ